MHQRLQEKCDYGRLAQVGTGPYKVTSFDVNEGIRVTANNRNSAWRRAGNIQNFHVRPIPDLQTQAAEFKVGNLDFLRLPYYMVPSFKGEKGVDISSAETPEFAYMWVDAAGRSGNKALKNEQVRRAIFLAIDRGEIGRQYFSGTPRALKRMCFEWQFACPTEGTSPAYDPATARSLLAKAGYANGFDLVIYANTSEKHLAEAIGGYLREIGIRPSIQVLAQSVFRLTRRKGVFQFVVDQGTFGGLSHVCYGLRTLVTVHTAGYWGDDDLKALVGEGCETHDPAKQRALFREAYDRINDQALGMTLSSAPATFVSRELKLNPSSVDYGVRLEDIDRK